MGTETRRVAGSKKKASPPIMSHEFVIQNHGDIMSCILMLVVIGFMFPITAPLSAIFVVPQYNETVTITGEAGVGSFDIQLYRNGLRDIFTILFYVVGWITVHAIIQEYVLDKLQRKVHLSKTKTYKFAESGHQLVFAAYSLVHAGYVISEFVQSYEDMKNIWLGYPDQQKYMKINMKLFFILQVAYWVHQFPEFYFQKMKKEEMQQRTFQSLIYIAFIGAGYIMNFHRLSVFLLAIQYATEVVFHAARLTHFLDKKNVAKSGFKLWNFLFIAARLATAVLAVVTFWHGLRPTETPYIDIAAGNFNTSYTRLNSMLCIIGLQVFMLWQFITFHFGRFRDNRQRKQKTDTRKKTSAVGPNKRLSKNSETESEAPESDPDNSANSASPSPAARKAPSKKQKAH